MLIHLKSQNITMVKETINFTTNPKDAALYLLKRHYANDVKIGDIILEKYSNKYNFDLFSVIEISYNKFQDEEREMLVINYNEPDTTEKYKKLVYKEFKEKIRIEIKLNKKEKCNNNIIQKFKNTIFKLFI